MRANVNTQCQSGATRFTADRATEFRSTDGMLEPLRRRLDASANGHSQSTTTGLAFRLVAVRTRRYTTRGNANSMRVPHSCSECTRTTLPCRSRMRLTIASPNPELLPGSVALASLARQ